MSELPDVGTNPVINGVFGGWQVTGVFQYQSGGWLSINSGVQFRAELFNLFNNVNLGGPSTDVSSFCSRRKT